MQISTNDWKNYIDRLAKLNQKAASEMQKYVAANGFADTDALIDFCYALVTKYGEGSAELACQMYDAMAEMANAAVDAAVPAATATYAETARAVQGSLLQSPTGLKLPQIADRLVKQAAADTTLQNAIRDHAQWAWVPSGGETCGFCITLASNGWQRASKRVLRGNHATHIHANCDCMFAIRFSENDNVKGYDPDYYKKLYDEAEGTSSKEKINFLRRKMAEHQRVINHVTNYGESARNVDFDYIKTQAFRNKFNNLTESPQVNDIILKHSRKILKDRTGTNLESLVLIDAEKGTLIGMVEDSIETDRISYNEKVEKLITKAREDGRSIFAIHNHPDGYPPTADDCESAGIRGYAAGISVGHNGNVYQYEPSFKGWSIEDCRRFHNIIALQVQYAETDDEVINTWLEMMKEKGFKAKVVE